MTVPQPVRRLPFGLRAKVDEKLDELLAKDIIDEVSHNPTEWVSPLVIVLKADGDIQICVDMRTSQNFFSSLIFATAKVAYITAMIIHLFILPSAVQIYEFSYIQFQHSGLYRYKHLMFGWLRTPHMGPMSPVCADPHWAGLCPVKTDKYKWVLFPQEKVCS